VTSVWGALRRLALGIHPREVTFRRRGFRAPCAETQRRLEGIGQTFLDGYHAALKESRPNELTARLDRVPAEMRGFAYEGAAMGLHLLDRLIGGQRLAALLNGAGALHTYLIHVGAGWVQARLGWSDRGLGALDPVHRWLVVDGYGFHEGYFHWRRYAAGADPILPTGYHRRAFDQGLGRSLWFVCGADPAAITAAVARLQPHRRADLWSGVGLACGYAGGGGSEAGRRLVADAGPFRADLAQGVAFAATARSRAGNPTPHTESASQVVCCLSAERAVRLTLTAREGVCDDADDPAYEVWRHRTRSALANILAGEREGADTHQWT
jgi:hypothetical protein